MNHTEFAISRFENRNGVTSWRVEGKFHGLRIRKNFKTREEAAAEQAALELKSLQIAAGLRPVMSSLSEDQVREAEALFRRVAGRSLPLSSYVDFALANYREPEKQKRLADAITEYVASKKHEHEQDLLSISQFLRIGRDLKRLQKHFPGASVADLSVQKLVGYFEHGRPALKTYTNRRGIVSTFLKFAFLRGWVAENPILKVPQQRIRRRRGMAATLSATQARELMEHMENYEGGRWVPYFALCLFAGIRPSVPHGEITKLKPEAIDLDAGVISVSAEVSKVREPRKVVIQPNLAAWPRAFGKTCTPAWHYLLSLPEIFPWVAEAFGSAMVFRECLCGHYLVLSWIEFLDFLRAGRVIEPNKGLHFDVPTLFFRPAECSRGVRRVLEDRPPLLALSSKFGVDAARQIAAWPEWVKVGFWWVSWALNHTYVDTSGNDALSHFAEDLHR